jgi:large subunit ribosomal protein L4e
MYVELTSLKTNVYDLTGAKVDEVELPPFFSYPVRIDLIRRAFISSLTKSIQPKGRDPMAGKRTTAVSFGINLGLARVPRVKNLGRARLAPNTRGGRRAFPPTPEKVIAEEINSKEMRLAVISALAATAKAEFVKARGHIFDKVSSLPIVVVQDFENLNTTSSVHDALVQLGLEAELERVKESKGIRAGKGKMRGRKYEHAKGPLIVVSSHEVPVVKAARNILGVEVVPAKDVSVIHLAPGGHPGRLTIFTLPTLKLLDERFRGRLL